MPHLRRLLVPEEEAIYTMKLHPLHGWPWLVGAVLVAIVGWWWKPLWVLATGLFVLYTLALQNFEGVVTTHRLLLRYGRFGVSTEGILGEKLASWQVEQTLLQRVLHAGSLRLIVKEGGTLRPLVIRWLWHPFTFIEALETLQMPPKV